MNNSDHSEQSLNKTNGCHEVEKCYVKVAVISPLQSLFDYLPPAASQGKKIKPGLRVQVPFGHQKRMGMVISTHASCSLSPDKLKCIDSVLDDSPLIPKDIMRLCHWVAGYYHYSMGETLSCALPVLLRKGQPAVKKQSSCWKLLQPLDDTLKKQFQRAPRQREALNFLQQHGQTVATHVIRQAGISSQILQQLRKKNLIAEVIPEKKDFRTITPVLNDRPLVLNKGQQAVFETVQKQNNAFRAFLLEGITGSGKTEVYLQLIEDVLKKKRQALVLVPEIGLTPQTIQRFQQRFSVPVVCLHSGMSDTERFNAWLDIARGEAGILIATRSGVFTPMPYLGLIIVDEEHDISYKQQTSLRYNARDIAIYRAKQQNCPVILGSATPSLESFYNAQMDRYCHLVLTHRAGRALLPVMKLLDIRNKPLKNGLSDALIQQITAHLEEDRQVMVFINRRGYSPSLLCHDCGAIIDCPHCDAHMTLHRAPPHMHCHHCDYQHAIPFHCPVCRSRRLKPAGQGTESLEQALAALFPDTPVLRMDRDSTRKKQALQHMLNTINTGRPAILLGTQMLAKGHHFPNVTLVAILDADAGLFSSDFRGAERTGQLIIQVAGRAGRGDKPGQVVIQTVNPEHPVLSLLISESYSVFANKLLQERLSLELPPHGQLALLRVQDRQSSECEKLLIMIRQYIELLEDTSGNDALVKCLGPVPAPMEKKQGVCRWNLLLQSQYRKPLHQVLNHVMDYMSTLRIPRQLRWSVDIDPQEMN
ncbi:Primosomal protein N' [invertebrate metagenome]|uniref:DNA 3'-5' helicase n=1 Tax=invertebrate metagenome TaxID=1711999 RepID=A0A2H9T9A0_9ZZZZ